MIEEILEVPDQKKYLGFLCLTASKALVTSDGISTETCSPVLAWYSVNRFPVGHAGEGITDRYSKLAENVELRKEWARRAGLGFELDRVGHPAPKLSLHPKAAKPGGTRKDPQPEAAIEADVIVPPNAGSSLPQHISEISKVPVKAGPAEPMFQASDSDLALMFFEEPAPSPTQEEIDAEFARLEELRMILEGVN